MREHTPPSTSENESPSSETRDGHATRDVESVETVDSDLRTWMLASGPHQVESRDSEQLRVAPSPCGPSRFEPSQPSARALKPFALCILDPSVSYSMNKLRLIINEV